MGKVLLFAVTLLGLSGIYCSPLFPFSPFRGPFPFERRHFPHILEIPDAQVLLDRFNKSGCLKEEIGENCRHPFTFEVFKHDFENCVCFLYGGCINNTRRVYTARECNGICALPTSDATTTTHGDTVTTNPTSLASDTATASSNTITQSSQNTATASSNTATSAASPTSQTSTTS